MASRHDVRLPTLGVMPLNEASAQPDQRQRRRCVKCTNEATKPQIPPALTRSHVHSPTHLIHTHTHTHTHTHVHREASPRPHATQLTFALQASRTTQNQRRVTWSARWRGADGVATSLGTPTPPLPWQRRRRRTSGWCARGWVTTAVC